jgi:hypothetical protein
MKRASAACRIRTSEQLQVRDHVGNVLVVEEDETPLRASTRLD